MTPVILAVSSELVSAGMQHILAAQGKHQVVGICKTFAELRECARQNSTAVVLLCSRLSGDATLESWRRLQRRYPDLLLLLWGRSFQDVLDFQCSLAQVHGYLLDNGDCSELLTAMDAMSRGQMYVAAQVAQYFARKPKHQPEQSLFAVLSNRELQVTQMIGRGVRVADIAKYLNISSKTVNTFRYRIFNKLGLSGDVALAHAAIQAGIVEVEQ